MKINRLGFKAAHFIFDISLRVVKSGLCLPFFKGLQNKQVLGERAKQELGWGNYICHLNY